MQTRIDVKAKTARYAFGSLAELGRYIDDTSPTWVANKSRSHMKATYWDLGLGYDGAVALAKDGWLEGASRLQDALKVFMPATPKPDVRNDFYGHTPNVPRFCAGAPDSMIRHHYAPTGGMGKVLTLIVPVNALGGVEADHMANFGLAVAHYVNQLETQGIRVELIGAVCSLVSGHRVTHTFVIKQADQFLDLAVVAFAIGHPAMFRRLGFAVRERCAVREDHSYGQTVSLKFADVIDPPPGAVILNGMSRADETANTPKAALAYVSLQIEKAIADNEANA